MTSKATSPSEFLRGLKIWSGIVAAVGFAAIASAAFSSLGTVSTWQQLTKTLWNQMSADLDDLNLRTVPSWAVMAFNLSTCPTGWSEADGGGSRPNLRWEFIRGWNRNATGADGWRSLGSWQNGTAFMGDGDGNNMPVPNLSDNTQRSVLWVEPDSTPVTGPVTLKYADPNPGGSTCTINGSTSWADASTCVSYARTRPRNVALLYCVKD